MKLIRPFTVLASLLLLATAGALAIDLSKGILLDIPPEVQLRQFGRVGAPQLTQDELDRLAAFRFDADTIKVLAILVEWFDRPGTYSPATLDSMLFSHDVYPGGSMADYFHEVSYAQVAVAGTIYGWYNAGNYDPYFDFEQILYNLNGVIDYSQFDGNNDGDVDAVVFVRSGTGQEDSHNLNDIWSYAYRYPPGSGPGPLDGVHIPAWNTSPELRPLRNPANPTQFLGVDSLNGIRVFCHETTHNLGLPDVYDYDAKLDTTTYFTPNDSNDHPFVDWCIMGYGGYGILSIKSAIPSHLCGWNKMQVGWIDPIELVGEFENLVIYDIETHKDSSLYRLPISRAEGEYYLLEFRNPRSTGKFDKKDSDFSCYFWPDLTYGCDTLDRGLLISHAHDSLGAYWWRINYGLPDYPHYTIAAVDAGYNPAMDYTHNPEGTFSDSAQWWYPYETRRAATFNPGVSGQTEFSPTTTPSSDGYFGATGIIVRTDSIVGDKLYAYVYNPYGDSDADGINVDGDQSGVEGDNPCAGGQTVNCDDNCPFVYNPDQADSNSNGIGDLCDFRTAKWDTVASACTELIVGNNGNFGHGGNLGQGGANMDYAGQGDCDPSANLYLYDGSPVVGYIEGLDTVCDFSIFADSLFRVPDNGRMEIPTITIGSREQYYSGTFISADSSLALEKTWTAYQVSDSCRFMLQRMAVYPWDGAAHSGLSIGEAVDWDVPSSSQAVNTGGFTADRVLYLRGTGTGCINNTTRFGGLTLLGYFVNDSCDFTWTNLPYGAYTADNNTWVYQTGGFVPAQLYTNMQTPGFSAMSTATDQHMVMTFFNDYSLGADDTLVVYSALISGYSLATANLDAIRAQAVAELEGLLGDNCTCCALVGDINHDGTGPDITDLVYLVSYMFQSGPQPPCPEETDMNGSGTPQADIADLVYLVTYMFQSGPAPVPCP